jgi:hypothetical protein
MIQEHWTAEQYQAYLNKEAQKDLPTKYRNTKVFYDGYWFDSFLEMQRYIQLKDLLKRKEISCLYRQVPFILQEPIPAIKQRAIKYYVDFMYKTKEGNWILEEVKALDRKTGKHRMTPDARNKLKMLNAWLVKYKQEIKFRIWPPKEFENNV